MIGAYELKIQLPIVATYIVYNILKFYVDVDYTYMHALHIHSLPVRFRRVRRPPIGSYTCIELSAI